MHKLFLQMVVEKSQTYSEPIVRIGGLKREQKEEPKEMAIAE